MELWGKLYSALFKNAILFPASYYVGYDIRRHYRLMKKSQWWSKEKLVDYQKLQLDKILKMAYDNVPFYMEKFAGKSLKPVLYNFPIIDKEVMRNKIADFKNKSYNRRLIPKSTSGSTGEPFQYFVDETWKGSKIASWLRGLEWTGYQIGDRYINVTGFPHGYFKKYPLLFKIEQKLSRLQNISPFDLSNDTLKETLLSISKAKVKLVRGYASSIYELAKYGSDNGIKCKIDAIVTTGETLFPEQRSIIEKSFSCKIFDEYGTDTGIIAQQCEEGRYHINCENVYIEIFNKNLLPCALGEEGEIVTTALNLYGFPMIRYNTHDVGSLSDEKCPCGRGLPILKTLEGRVADMIITGKGKILTLHMFTGLFMPLKEISQFRVVQVEPNRFIFELVTHEILSEGFINFLNRKIETLLGAGVKFELRFSNNLPLNERNAKRKFFVKTF